jgi:hypothetical protein
VSLWSYISPADLEYNFHRCKSYSYIDELRLWCVQELFIQHQVETGALGKSVLFASTVVLLGHVAYRWYTIRSRVCRLRNTGVVMKVSTSLQPFELIAGFLGHAPMALVQ